MGMSNVPSVTVTSDLGALGVSGLTDIFPENVPATRAAQTSRPIGVRKQGTCVERLTAR